MLSRVFQRSFQRLRHVPLSRLSVSRGMDIKGHIKGRFKLILSNLCVNCFVKYYIIVLSGRVSARKCAL
jgi:hypothetical protein